MSNQLRLGAWKKFFSERIMLRSTSTSVGSSVIVCYFIFSTFCFSISQYINYRILLVPSSTTCNVKSSKEEYVSLCIIECNLLVESESLGLTDRTQCSLRDSTRRRKEEKVANQMKKYQLILIICSRQQQHCRNCQVKCEYL